MSRQGSIRRAAGRTARLATSLALAVVSGLGSSQIHAQPAATPPPPTAAPPVVSTVAPPRVALPPTAFPVAPADAPGTAVVGGPEANTAPAGPVLPPDIQVVRFQGPAGLKVEVLGPNPEPVPTGDGKGVLTTGLKVGTSYRLRVTGLPERPSAELFPVIDMVGHLHRPAEIDPARYPVRIVFSEEDFVDVADHGRLVTQVVYLEDPEQALPIALPKDQIPVVTLNPSEEPLKVASALGRVVAIVRMGARRPTPEESASGSYGPPGMPGGNGPCPFTQADGGKCPLVCGPARGTPPPAGRPWLPKDEYLCDGGDHAESAHFGGDGGLRGIEPRDAVLQFDDGRRSRALPTNTVCVYAPRFAEIRTSVGPNESLTVEAVVGSKYLEKQASESGKQGPKRLAQNQGLEAARVRERASGLGGKVRAGVHGDLRAASGYENSASIAAKLLLQGSQTTRDRAKLALMKDRAKGVGIKTAESAVLTGIVEGAGQSVMAWRPTEAVGVETPPDRPGMAVIKRVSASEAEPGDTLTYVIQYRNMGNTPIKAVTVVDSLLPRLVYVRGTAQGPRGTIFTSEENQAGSTELKWILPGTIPPGVEGHVSFQAIVR